MEPRERQSLISELGAQIGFLNDWQVEALGEAVIKADTNGIDVHAALRNLAKRGDRFDLPAVMSALRPSSTAGAQVPYHLPNCRCVGTGWVDCDKQGHPIDVGFDRPPGDVVRCGEGGPISQAMFDSWKASQPAPTRKVPTA